MDRPNHRPLSGPYGQPRPGQPVGPGPAPGYPAAPPPREPTNAKKPKTRNAKLFRVGIVAVIVLMGYTFVRELNGPTTARPGDCITIHGSDADETQQVDCGSADAVYKVAVAFDDNDESCPNGDYTSYTEEGRRARDLLLCLTLNAKQGDCFETNSSFDVRIDCTDRYAEFKVTKVIKNSDDRKKCGRYAKDARAYPEPKLTLCVGPPRGKTR